ncbi:MAG: GNAT family N-acetyltransferase [Bacteroidia bacterium]|nr:GNAT family N-acetyltransferase [Bacteroidia bacterium]
MSVNDIEIILVNKTEAELLRTISIQTFTETFANQNTESDMQKYISERLSIEQLNKELNSENSMFYFLNYETEVAGYLKLNVKKSQTEDLGNDCVEIERIYIKKEYQGKAFGKALMEKAIDIAKQSYYKYIWLAVWEHNTKAINFYKKLGFIEFDKHTFQLGDDLQIDIMMKFELK